MKEETILWQLLGLSPLSEEKYSSLHIFQLQLVVNLIENIKYISFFTSQNNPLKEKETNNANTASHFDDSLLENLDKSSPCEADIIVSYYILERLFGFNLSYEMAQSLEKSSNYGDFIKNSDMEYIVQHFDLLFQIPDISSRIKYFDLFVNLYYKKLKMNDISDKEDFKSHWLCECENFLKYIYYYITPKVDFIFLFLYEKIMDTIGEDKMENLLSEFIIKNCIYPKNKDDYMKRMYIKKDIDKIYYNNTEDFAKIKNKVKHWEFFLKYGADIFFKDIVAEYKTYSNYCNFDFITNHPPKIADVGIYPHEIEINKTDCVNYRINNLINHKNPFTDYSEIKNIFENCNPDFLTDLFCSASCLYKK